LSRERSEVIKNFLVINGIKKSQIKVKGLGPTKPRVSNDSEESRKLNRRVEILIN
jgi:outer membrane protein OmpA-like peptidoglycan-associated protein